MIVGMESMNPLEKVLAEAAISAVPDPHDRFVRIVADNPSLAADALLVAADLWRDAMKTHFEHVIDELDDGSRAEPSVQPPESRVLDAEDPGLPTPDEATAARRGVMARMP